MTTVYFSLPGGAAEFEVRDFQAAGRFRWGEPPEPGEITLENDGIWTNDDGDQSPITMEGLVRLYMYVHGVGETEAARRIEDDAYDDVMNQMEEAFDDR